jgi:ribonucleoside-diphosphate reductase alpha chain
MLVQMGILYGSDESLEIARKLMTVIDHRAKQKSRQLAEERGTFTEWESSKYAQPQQYRDWFREHTGEDADDWPQGFPIRNHHVTTIAPTGTTSAIANTSSGCEPLFNTQYSKRVSEDIAETRVLLEINDYFKTALQANGIDFKSLEKKKLRDSAKSRTKVKRPDIPENLRDLFVVAHDVDAEQHVRMQAAFQSAVDSSISKTINFGKNASHKDVEKAYFLAIETGCKGITVYREGSRKTQVLTRR